MSEKIDNETSEKRCNVTPPFGLCEGKSPLVWKIHWKEYGDWYWQYVCSDHSCFKETIKNIGFYMEGANHDVFYFEWVGEGECPSRYDLCAHIKRK